MSRTPDPAAPRQLDLFGQPKAGARAQAGRRNADPGPDGGPLRGHGATGPVQVAADPGGAERLVARLGDHLDRPVANLVLTRNRSRIASAKALPGDRGLELRVHRCFTTADDQVVRALAAFLGGRRGGRARALELIRAHFRRHGQDDTEPGRRPRLDPVGRHFDLRRVRDRVNERYFDGQVVVGITWGRPTSLRRTRPKRRRRGFSIRLGSYQEAHRLVRVHRVLDRGEVPPFVVESIVHHEMLHAVVPTEMRNGRRCVHTDEFRRRERQFERFAEAEAWLNANVERLARLR